ncbi:hypothetical protein Tco_0867051, partial [Tanacetum coccineum]
SYGNSAHIGYICPPQIPIISNSEQCNQTINELPQTLPSVHPTCNSGDENSFNYDSKPNFIDDFPNVFNPPPQPSLNSCEFCGNDARYGHYCTHQVPFIYPKPCYNQDFNVPQDFHDFQQQYLCCENCRGPHETFQCQPMNEDYYEQNSCYYPNSFGFDQYQPSQFPDNHQFPQEMSNEILQARDDLMEAIQAFLMEYDHIPPNEKCMALLLAEERFLKIKQAMEEEQNQPEVMQELLLKLMDDLQILKGSQQEKKETAAQSFTPYWKFSIINDKEARNNFLKDVCTFLRKFNRIPFGVTPNVILIAWESFGKIKDALTDEQYQQEDIQELMSKLLEDFKGISEDTCDVPVCEDPSTFDALNDHSEILSDSNDDDTSSNDNDFEDIGYVSLEEKLLNVHCLIANIEALNDNPSPNRVLKSPSLFPIPVEDSDSFFEKSDTSLSHLDNSLPEFETFSDDTEETRSGSTTTHAHFFFRLSPIREG